MYEPYSVPLLERQFKLASIKYSMKYKKKWLDEKLRIMKLLAEAYEN